MHIPVVNTGSNPDAHSRTHNGCHTCSDRHSDPGCHSQYYGKCDGCTVTQALTISPVGTVYVPVGTTVCWINNDPYKPHGVRSIGTNSGYNFGTVNIPYGSMYNVTFSNKGSYDYVTVFQPQVAWKIVAS
jgi:hypothetical protein